MQIEGVVERHLKLKVINQNQLKQGRILSSIHLTTREAYPTINKELA